MRSKRSLVQTMGRAARHVDGRVILYADKRTVALDYALEETQRRREKQLVYNLSCGITPRSIKKSINDILASSSEQDRITLSEREDIPDIARATALGDYLKVLENGMRAHAREMNFERAALFRDEISRLSTKDFSMPLSVLDLERGILDECLERLGAIASGSGKKSIRVKSTARDARKRARVAPE